ncbi:hypothetical protein [Yoonia algicola]|uniref:Uncharacterized protein n=1 Tax=Yoonia algicola TaxID=3137368 RepID=A0AAN0NHD2_9RHOB
MKIEIPADDFGQIRVFATDITLSPEVIEKTPRGLEHLFDADLNPDYIDIVRVSDLDGMALSTYIATGYDMAADLVDKAAVDAITGYAILVLSRATGGIETTLTLAEGVTHVTTYSPIARIVPQETLTSAASEGTLPPPPAKAPKSDARMSGMVATYALLAMFALVALMIWVGG